MEIAWQKNLTNSYNELRYQRLVRFEDHFYFDFNSESVTHNDFKHFIELLGGKSLDVVGAGIEIATDMGEDGEVCINGSGIAFKDFKVCISGR